MIALVHQGIACLEEATLPGHAIEIIPWRESFANSRRIVLSLTTLACI